jgi:microcystin-dependent protein
MADPFLGEIILFGGNFAPSGWAFCNGQLLSISQNTALFSLLGTTYGGDGMSTFALPNLQGRAPIHAGQGPGLSPYLQGQSGGTESVTLDQRTMPAHSHAARGVNAAATATSPTNNAVGVKSALYVAPDSATAACKSLASAGGGQPHNNLQPYLALNYIIALQGIFPSRS